ncbi:Uncharacterised protein [Mycobacteroides abscessus subsp. abscessus]|nr:Uncharacterised protein [Mycobacteroides abscessus subsp. abscessus]
MKPLLVRRVHLGIFLFLLIYYKYFMVLYIRMEDKQDELSRVGQINH